MAFEQTIVYAIVGLIFLIIFGIYFSRKGKYSRATEIKVEKAKEQGLYEPVSLHPVVDAETCIGSGACIKACPEKDVLGMHDGKAIAINASRCVGHGACFHACPVQAITVCIGTEKRGVELPHISQEFESNVPGLYIAGELGGMGLIKNAVEQGRQAVENLSKHLKRSENASYDLIIVGAGPAGISAALTAAQLNLKFLTLEQDSLGGTVFSFPRAKIVMTQPMDLPMYGKIKLSETSKSELLEIWRDVLSKNKITINEQEKVESVEKIGNYFLVKTSKHSYTSSTVLLSIGRRGSPRKLGIPGEGKEKVAYRLLEPEMIHHQDILVVGGGDSAVEAALLLSEEKNNVVLSYRGEGFTRLKPKNLEKINRAVSGGIIELYFNSSVQEIFDEKVIIMLNDQCRCIEIKNDLVYIFAGGELPTQFLERIGIAITKKFGDALLKPKK